MIVMVLRTIALVLFGMTIGLIHYILQREWRKHRLLKKIEELWERM